MEKYLYVNRPKDINRIFLSKKFIGAGSEGSAYLTVGNKLLKIFHEYRNTSYLDSEKENIIMAQDYNLKSFYFPETLFICNGLVEGYLSDYFEGNILDYSNKDIVDYFSSDDDATEDEKRFIKMFIANDINRINSKKVLEAREKLIADTKILTDDHIVLYDIYLNLLFNGSEFGVVDTLQFYTDPRITLDQNIKYIDNAILGGLHIYDESFKPDYSLSVEENLQRIRN